MRKDLNLYKDLTRALPPTMEGVLELVHAQLKLKEDEAYLESQRKPARDAKKSKPREVRGVDRIDS